MQTPELVNIVLYKNRKFYCKQRSCYITLSDIYNMYRVGIKLQISEYEGSRDITKDIVFKAISLCGLNYETKIKLLSKMGERL